MKNIQSCKHPIVVRNKYTGEEISVPCGRCSACTNNRAFALITRCDLESQSHRYSVFATLTYADYDVPQLVRLRSCDCSHPNELTYIDGETGEFIDFFDSSIKRHTERDIQYVRDTKVLPVLCKSDFQKFIKRFRYYANQIEDGVTIRYFLTGEYGETTYRPHGHIILWFDSDAIAQQFKEILYKSWRHGNVYDPHFINGSASSYVAAYVNGIVRLPSIYSHKHIKPFVLFSKCPILGSLYQCVPTIQQFFFDKVDKISVPHTKTATFTDVPLWRSLLDRFCPRIQRFSELSVADRITLYRLIDEHVFEDRYKFAEFLYYRYVRSNRVSFVSRYLYDICHYSVRRMKFSKDGELRHSIEFELATCINSLVQFCAKLQLAKQNASLLQISVTDYVILMSNYFDDVRKTKYKEYCEYRDEYFKSVHAQAKDFLLFDYTFVKRVNGKELSCLSPSDKHYLWMCGAVDDSTTIVHLCLDDCINYQKFCVQSDLLANDLVKKKTQFDYLFSKSDDFKNVINYFCNE